MFLKSYCRNVRLGSVFVFFRSRALFTRLTNTKKCNSNFKIRFYSIIYPVKNYFTIIFLILNFLILIINDIQSDQRVNNILF